MSATKNACRSGRTLTIELPEKGKTVFEVGTEPVIIGRDESCTVVVAGKRTSKVHAEVVATEDGALVRDLGSTNGTRINDVLIRDTHVILTRPAKIECGDGTLLFTPTRPAELEVHETEFGPLVGASSDMRELFASCRKIAPTPLSVLVHGETGAGKELVARAIHEASDRANKPFITVDCSAIPTSLAESVFFGHERGAFTGAVDKRVSPFVEADGGTIFLDEIGELALEVQQKLLRILERHEVKSVGSNAYRTVNIRVIAATHRDLHKDVNEGRFRADLLFRLANVRISLPPLRKRKDDIPLLVQRIAKSLGFEAECQTLTLDSLAVLQEHDWPGNVRELRNVLSYAFWSARRSEAAVDFAEALGYTRERATEEAAAPESRGLYKEELETFAKNYFRDLARVFRGNRSKIAAHAGVERSTVRRYLEKDDKGDD